MFARQYNSTYFQLLEVYGIIWRTPCAFERAAELIERAATSVPRADAALVPLMGDDGYGVRNVLADVIASRKVIL